MEMINLEALTGGGKVHNLSGRLRGQAARDEFNLDLLDRSDEPVEVHVPSYVYSVTPSFFQGLFGDSFRACGHDVKRFRSHYVFVAPSIVLEQFERGIAALSTSRDLGDVH